jgi:hypothetical protein
MSGSIEQSIGHTTSLQKHSNNRFDAVILNKVDKDGNLSLLFTRPLTAEIFNQIPDSMIVFTDGRQFKFFF